MQPAVLIGFAEAMSAPEVVWSLADEGYKVFAFARRGRRSALRYSRHVTCREITPPEVDASAALSELNAICEDLLRQAPLVLFPLDDAAVWLCARSCERPGLVLAGASLSASKIALDKAVQIEVARNAGFNVPKTALCSSPGELQGVDQGFPLIIKPAKAVWETDGSLRKGGFWICGNPQEKEAAVSKWAGRVPVLAQPFIQGTGEGVFGLATENGVRAWSAHRRLRMMNPHGSGSSACASQTVSDDLMAAAARFIEQAGWRGLFMIELLRDASGTVWFVEFNARPWGSIALARRQGLEYPAWHVALALDPLSGAGKATPCNDDPVVCRNLGRELMHVLFVLKGPKSMALQRWPSFWKTMPEVLRVRREDRWYNWRKDDAKVFASDCYFTIQGNIVKPRKAT